MPRNCESVSLTFEAQLSKSKVARVRADAALTADADMGNSQLRLFASADSRQPAADGCAHCSSQVVESLAADVSHFAAELARTDTGADRAAPQALHVSAVMIHKDFEYTLVKPSDLTHLTKEINVCSILQQQTVKTHSWFSRASCCVRVRARCAAACACARRCASCARVRCAHGWTVAV